MSVPGTARFLSVPSQPKISLLNCVGQQILPTSKRKISKTLCCNTLKRIKSTLVHKTQLRASTNGVNEDLILHINVNIVVGYNLCACHHVFMWSCDIHHGVDHSSLSVHYPKDYKWQTLPTYFVENMTTYGIVIHSNFINLYTQLLYRIMKLYSHMHNKA